MRDGMKSERKGTTSVSSNLNLRMRRYIFQSPPRHLLLASICQQRRSLLQSNPSSPGDLRAHRRTHVIDAAGSIEHQVEADDLKHTRAISPSPHVNVLAVAQLRDRLGDH